MSNIKEHELIEGYKKILVNYLPSPTVHTIALWIRHYNFDLKITAGRSTKLGDYRSPYGGKRHRISINHNLNPYSFLITLVHEVAHLTTYQKHKHPIKPHGLEWRSEFQALMTPFLNQHILPPEVEESLKQYLLHPAASTCSDDALLRALKKYDKSRDHWVHLEEIPQNSIFRIAQNRIFEKREKLRKRYKCIEINTQRVYLFSPLAEVIPFKPKLEGKHNKENTPTKEL